MSSLSSGFDAYIVYKIVRALSTPFEDMEAYNLGLIDKNGKRLRKAKTSEEKDAMTYFDRLIINMKRIMNKAGLSSKTATFAAALLLLKEADDLLTYDDDKLTGMLEEEIANAMGTSAAPSQSPAGNVALYDPLLGNRKRGRPRVMNRYINGVSYIKRTAKRKRDEQRRTT